MSLYNDASLVLIPSGYKEGKLYSIKPTDGGGDFTFSRASSATRVNSSGLIEKETQNLLLQSNTFDTTWNNVLTGTITGGQSGYDGSSDAWLIDKGAVNGRIQQNFVQSGVQTYSCYAKAGTSNWMSLMITTGTGDRVAFFDLQNGVVGTGFNLIDKNIESVGGGWYRCSITFIETSITARIYVSDGDNDNTGTSGSIYIQDAQLNQGLVADSYLETTTTAVYGGITDDLPRLDYTDASCPSLLVETQRTNLVTQSEYLESANFGSAQILNTTDTTPEGSSNARVLAYDGGTNQHYVNFVPSVTNGQTYTFSVFLKKKELQYAALIFLNDFAGQFFDLENGTILGAINGGPINSTIKDYGNGWYRCSITDVATSTTKYSGVYLSENGTSYGGFTPTNTDGLYLYGAQLEEGSYATSYIPTYGASVTALKDDCYNLTFSDLQTTDATIFVEFNYDSGKTGAFRFVFCSENSTTGSLDSVQLNSSASGVSFSFNIQGSGISFSTLSLLDGNNKALIKFERSTGAVKTFLNGVEVDSGTAASIPEIHKLAMGSRMNPFASFARDRQFGDIVSQFLAFPTALTDSECIALTTL